MKSRGLEEIRGIRSEFQKATIVDECLYEGDIEMRWGNITAKEDYLLYMSFNQPAFVSLELPGDIGFTADIIDTWEMAVPPGEKLYREGAFSTGISP